MAFITGKILQGNCGAVTYMGDGHYLCGPIPDQPGLAPSCPAPSTRLFLSCKNKRLSHGQPLFCYS